MSLCPDLAVMVAAVGMAKKVETRDKYLTKATELARMNGTKQKDGKRTQIKWSEWFRSPAYIERQIEKIIGMMPPKQEKKPKKQKRKKTKTKKINIKANENTEIKNKEEKIQNRVKRPPNSYLIYHKERYTILKEKNQELKTKDITKRTSEEWRTMNEEQKKTFKDKYTELKRTYDQELKTSKLENT